MYEVAAWIIDWPGSVVFVSAVVVLRILYACLGALDRWRYRRLFRGQHKPLWRQGVCQRR
jgi:hypothetical protein